MYVHIMDYHGEFSWFKVLETGKAPNGFEQEGKVSVVFINSAGEKEKSIVNHHHIQIKRIAKPYFPDETQKNNG